MRERPPPSGRLDEAERCAEAIVAALVTTQADLDSARTEPLSLRK